MKSLTAFSLVVFLFIGSAIAQDYQKNSNSYLYYGGIPSKDFNEVYKKSGVSKSKGGSYESSKNSLKIGIIEAIMGKPGIFYERALTPFLAVEVGVGVNFNMNLFGTSNNGNFFRDKEVGYIYNSDRDMGFQWSLIPKFYPGKSAQNGFYIAMGIQQSVLNIKPKEYVMNEQVTYKVKSKEFGIGGGLGAQMAFSKVIFDYNVLFFYNTIKQTPQDNNTEVYNLKDNTFQITYSVKIGGFWGGGKKSKKND